MDFELSSDQSMLADSVDRFGREVWPAADRPRLLAAYGRGEVSNWRQMADLGWLALPLSEAQGGLGGRPSDLMVVAEGLGRHLVPEPFISSCVLAASLLEPSRTELLDAVVSGDTKLALAVGDGDSRFNHLSVATTATSQGGGYVLSGVKQFVADGADADHFVVPARTSGAVDALDGISLFLVPRGAPGLGVDRFRATDHHRHARLRLDNVSVGSDALIGEEGGSGMALGQAVKRAIIAHCAEAVGAMDALRDITLEYLKTRRQFGAAIGSFQALQHKMVDIAIACEEARSITFRATLELEAGVLDKGRMASAAKARVGQTGLFVGRQAVQLHGGVGTSDELVVSHYLKRLMMIDMAYGHADHHRARFAAAA
jgi:alkylation response protein AidB-like acyl-CoA dehydrogenase